MMLFALMSVSTMVFAQTNQVSVVSDDDGVRLVANGEDFMVNGMNWTYDPIGTNYSYSLWLQPDDVIRSALDSEMSLLKNMGVNTIRVYTGMPAKWITHIYEKYGIYTMLNHSFGRYGVTIGGSWIQNTDYGDVKTRELLLSEATELVKEYKGTPGLLLFLLGNENNYGLFWDGAETEDIPLEDRKSTARAREMYKLFNEAVVAMKAIDTSVPVAICNGDLLFLDIIAEECKDIDIFGTNMYRGISFGDAFQRVKDELNKPILFTEFGADAYNAQDNTEDQYSQAYYMVGNWKEIYQNASGLGKSENSLGGFTFQFSDGWWKYGQTKNLDLHDNNASWANGGYQSDFVEGENNMNEEWFGICAKGENNDRGLYQVYPRAAYYALKEAHGVNPYQEGVSAQSIEDYFSTIELADAVLKARGDAALLVAEQGRKVRLSTLRIDMATYNTGGKRISTPDEADPDEMSYPNELGFDHMQSFYMGIEAQPTDNIRAEVNFNVLGNIPLNAIDEIYYENRGRPETVLTPTGKLELEDVNRFQVYNAEFDWKHKWFELKGFYRTGQYHWGYEGDFFGLRRESQYGPNLDIYNGNAPFGFEIAGKKNLEGLTVALGPELWWGANPAILVKYSRTIRKTDVTGIYHEDIADAGTIESSFAIPEPVTRRIALHAERQFGPFGIEVGGLWAGQPLNGREYQIVDETGEDPTAYVGTIETEDNFGIKAKLTFSKGPFNWYAQGAAQGLVANGGSDQTQTFTGWRLKDSGSGNQYNVLTGFTVGFGNFQIAPNFLWQKPIVGPMPLDVEAPGRLRNILDDPFVVRANRETVAGEILLTFDPTPGSWFYEWNNDEAEDAKFAMNAGFVYRHHKTSTDAAIGIFSDGRTSFPFDGAPPAKDLWEVHSRMVSKINPDLGFILNIYGGTGQANGSDARLVKRFGTDLRFIYKKMKLTTDVKVNDWGPYDYHRDFNQTFPVQLTFDLSTSVSKASWWILPSTKIGVRYSWRSLDQYSNRYCPAMIDDGSGVMVCDPDATGFKDGREWEFRTYVQIHIGK
ncbi:MAG: glycosidase [Bacteroidetes bacterium]|nr:glycosidase [Bacteroidota bacterium]